jgi:N-acetylneuraminate lyase
MTLQLTGLVAATHSPFNKDGSLLLESVAKQAEMLLQDQVQFAFITGTTGESSSLTVEERLALTQRWCEVTRGTKLQIVVHVGANSLHDAATLAAAAQTHGAVAIAALAPSYFKPKSVTELIQCCQQITHAAPNLPFYFYDIPVLTGVNLSMVELLERSASELPTLRGIKFTNPDQFNYQRCLHACDGRYDIPWGIDEALLAALALGAKGGVGSTYNFAAPLYHRLMSAFAAGDLNTARQLQYYSVQLVATLVKYGYMSAAKELMNQLGVQVGPARLPNSNLTESQRPELRRDLEQIGFWDWGR